VRVGGSVIFEDRGKRGEEAGDERKEERMKRREGDRDGKMRDEKAKISSCAMRDGKMAVWMALKRCAR